MDALVILVPLLPFLAAIGIVTCYLLGYFPPKKIITDIATGSATLSFLMVLTLLISDFLGKNHGFFSIGSWLVSDSLNIRVNFITTGINIRLAAFFAGLLLVVGLLSSNQPRHYFLFLLYYFIFDLFFAGVLFAVLSANMVGFLVSTQLLALCLYFACGNNKENQESNKYDLKILIYHFIGDIGLMIGIALSYFWLESVNWHQLDIAAEQLSIGQATGISLCFILAAISKAGQLPFTPSLIKSIEQSESPLPMFYCLIVAHIGIVLLFLQQSIITKSPFALAVLGLIGLSTVIYSAIVSLSQANVKSWLAFTVTVQTGLMCIEISLGFWQLALGHLGLHLLLRCYQCFFAKNFLKRTPSLSTPVDYKIPRALYISSLQRFWLDEVTEWVLEKPITALALDLSYFDAHIVGRLIGDTGLNRWMLRSRQRSSLLSPELNEKAEQLDHNSGFIGYLMEWAATLTHRIEGRFVLRSIGRNTILYGRQFARLINQFEQLILRPRYLVLFVCITFLIAF